MVATAEDRTGLVQKELTTEEYEQHSAKLASLECERIDLEELKGTKNREWNERLRQLNTDIEKYAKAVDTRTAWVPAQADLFDGESANDTDTDGEEEAPRAKGRRGRRGARAEASASA